MNKKAFTLIEMIAVLAIIGVIILISIPAGQNLVKNNKQDKYKIYVETVEKAIYTYADLYMKNDSNVNLTHGDDVQNSIIGTTLSLEKFEGATSVTFADAYKIIKKSNGRVIITTVTADPEPVEFKLYFDGTGCTKKEC